MSDPRVSCRSSKPSSPSSVVCPSILQIEILEGGKSVPLINDATVSTLLLQHRRACLGYVIDLPRAPEFLPERARALGVPVDRWTELQQGQPIGSVQPEDVTGPPRDGLRLALVTDTAYFPALKDFVSGSDLLVCESTFVLDEDEDRARERGHMTLRQATHLASEANVKQLWLTHFSPKVEEPLAHAETARALFPNSEIGRSGLCTELSYP